MMLSSQISVNLRRAFHGTPTVFKAQAGRFKVSKFGNKPLTYDEAFKPHNIAVCKGWLSVHTGNLHGEKGASGLVYEDQFIRIFLNGTFHRLLSTSPLIKRRFNIVEVVVFVDTPLKKQDSIYFLRFYSERLLSAFLKCNVKLYVHHVDGRDMRYKFV